MRVRDVTVAGGGGGGAGLQRGHPPAGHPGRKSSLSTIRHFVFSNTNLKIIKAENRVPTEKVNKLRFLY